jgi:hypothetical protein
VLVKVYQSAIEGLVDFIWGSQCIASYTTETMETYRNNPTTSRTRARAFTVPASGGIILMWLPTNAHLMNRSHSAVCSEIRSLKSPCLRWRTFSSSCRTVSIRSGYRLYRDDHFLLRCLTVFGRVDDKASASELIHIMSHVRRSARLRSSAGSSSIKKVIIYNLPAHL